ncbi:MAG: CsgG/HfaB family protein [Elusimicrobiales bacterium]|nr:CsgG/HfaB family protein [Elusimicrobiales bacterium]
MKNITKILAAVLLLACAAGAYAEDNYSQLAREITEAGASVQGKKIAIIPFSYADGRAAAKDGSVISERLTIKMINMHKFEIIERSVLDKVMAELKLQASGTIDASSAQQLGKVLGVEAIVTGTLVEMQAGEIEVNARLIKTETAQAIGASQVTLKKDWIGDAATAPAPVQPQTYQQPAYQQPSYQQPAPAPAQRAPRGEFAYGFFDIFFGFGAPNMALEFSNSNANITINNTYTNDIGINVPAFTTNRDFRTVRFDKLATEGAGPIAFRVGGFGNGPLGGDLELSYEKRNIKAQTAAWLLNGAAGGNVTFSTNDYATVKSFGISGDLLMRIPTKKADPYFGIGAGMSLNSVTLPYAKGFTNSSLFSRPVEDMGVGFMFRVPVGVRFKPGKDFQIVTELRYEMNHIMFDRGISGESDTITLSGAKFIVGMGFTF